MRLQHSQPGGVRIQVYMPRERVTIRRAALGIVKGGIGKTSAEYYRICMVAGVVKMGRE